MAQAANGGCKALYVGNLDPRVTDDVLKTIFAVIAPVGNVKIIRDRNYSHGGLNYGFVEFNEHSAAEQALQAMNGRSVFGQEIRVNWAAQGSAQKEDTTGHFHIFVGDLSPEVTDTILANAFTPFRTLSEARVMWDQSTGKSRGFGFVAFRDRADAEQAIATMNGEWLGSRAIRCNWANQKNASANMAPSAPVIMPNQYMLPGGMSYEQIFAQTSPYHTTVYIGNLPHGITRQEIAPYFHQYGYVTEIRMQPDRGFAFVKMDTHANAASAIFTLQGYMIGGRPVRLSWGKDRNTNNSNTNIPAYDPYAYSYPPSAAPGFAPAPIPPPAAAAAAAAAGVGGQQQNWVPGYDMNGAAEGGNRSSPAAVGAAGVAAAAAAATGVPGVDTWNSQQQQQQQQQQYYQQYYNHN